MAKLSKQTFDAIKNILVKLCDTHKASYDNAWGNSDKIIGKALLLKDIENGRTSQFNAKYYFHPIKGIRRPNVRREYAEIEFFYQPSPTSQQLRATPMDTYQLFTDVIITHYIQESKPHTTERGTLSYTRTKDDLSEEEGRDLFRRLKQIFDEEYKKGLIEETHPVN